MPALPFPQKQRREKLGKHPTKKKKAKQRSNDETKESKYMPALPFPQKQRREKLDKQFGHFLEVFKQVQINLPFTEVRSQMSGYAKFFKDILSNKWKAEETSKIGRRDWRNQIYTMSLQLVDQTTIMPEGIVEDILVRMEKFTFPVDFIVLILRVGEERVVFKMKEAVGAPRDNLMAYPDSKADSIKELAKEVKHDKCGVLPKKAEENLGMDVCTGSGVQGGSRY
ncbi:PREDICTED: uncharacterized protein LOC109226232 [Nicotiana attenuata]|uniref:uncharacterized protein LOC109226232 n=1 Tax=Nicotiana attenuata TaxID=49451 RepID=UPI000904723E|nr:PREDICTED: uncharacterized protein LOC109226232 [Nicotiana attenuata]